MKLSHKVSCSKSGLSKEEVLSRIFEEIKASSYNWILKKEEGQVLFEHDGKGRLIRVPADFIGESSIKIEESEDRFFFSCTTDFSHATTFVAVVILLFGAIMKFGAKVDVPLVPLIIVALFISCGNYFFVRNTFRNITRKLIAAAMIN